MEKSTHTNQNPQMPPSNNKSSTTVGAIIILFGVFLLLNNLDLGFLFPDWLFSFPMILIIIGLVIGINSKFEKKSALILLTIGGIFLLRKIFHDFNPFQVLFPAIAIVIGIYIINRNRKVPTIPTPPENTNPPHPTDEFDWDRRVVDLTDGTEENNRNSSHANAGYTGTQEQFQYAENYLKIDAIFGNSKKIILSKNFLGGTITNIFGSSVINLLQADITQPVVIDSFQLFGSIKIIVPPHWVVTPSVSSIFGDVDDRRIMINHPYDDSKKLYLTGTSLFGTVTIKNS
jgi:predicted membrane protein